MTGFLNDLLEQTIRADLSEEEVLHAATTLAAALWQRSRELETHAERQQRQRLSNLMVDAKGQAFSTLLTDRAFRSKDTRKLASQVGHLIDELGIPQFVGMAGRWQLGAARILRRPLHAAIARGVRARMLAEARHVLIDANDDVLRAYLQQRRQQGATVNVNYLGEAVLSEAEVERRMEHYMQLLRRPDVSTISVKVSSIDCRVDSLAFDSTLERLCPRLSTLYQAALDNPFLPPDGQATPKLINLDMESYAEMAITQALFQRVLDEPRFLQLSAGMVLQAYLPDAFDRQQMLTTWAQQRVENGGAPVRLRIVKGANLAMERVTASLRGFELPIYSSKNEVDANYKRMLEFAARPEHARAVHVGVASHNVFDLALALVLRTKNCVQAQVGLELLEGMADPLRRALSEVCDNVLVYSPIVNASEIHSGIAYLVRRLDENTSEENFLHHSFAMDSKGAQFSEQQALFEQAYLAREQASSEPRRRPQVGATRVSASKLSDFQNEPDTDFVLVADRKAIASALAELTTAQPPHLVASKYTGVQGKTSQGFDPSRPGAVPYTFELLQEDELDNMLERAQRAQTHWSKIAPEKRGELLASIAQQLRVDRAGLVARMVIDGGKRMDQADTEVSEAIDFADYYRLSFLELCKDDSVSLGGAGVSVITPPWNFPLAIAAGGTLASLMAGNAVILKQPMETPWVAHRFAELCWQAGLPEDVLQLCFCEDEVGSRLIRDPRTTQVVLTGGTATAKLFWSMRPDLQLFAETGGKNAIIVSAMADRDQAIADAVHSAFGHAGQKCSAASLLICEAEIYDDPKFLQQLQEMVESLPVGSAHNPKSVVTPLITPPRGALQAVMVYDEDTVGFLMSNEMVTVRETQTLEQTSLQLRQLKELPIHNDKLFVVDLRGVFKGVITLQSILLNDPKTRVSDVMATNVVTFVVDDNASEASKAFERYDLVSAPVLNQRGKLVGRVTVDIIMDYIRDESSDDVINMMGLKQQEDLFSPVLSSARNRGSWLIVNLFTAFFVAYVIGLFEHQIAQLVALAVLMPIVASIGGNTGNQTTALIIRGISLGTVHKNNIIYLFRKELAVSLLNGIVLGIAVGIFAFLFFRNYSLSLVIGAATLINLIVAATVGLGVPLFLKRMGRDPALGSSVITTATTDSMGFLIFLGLATVFLL